MIYAELDLTVSPEAVSTEPKETVPSWCPADLDGVELPSFMPPTKERKKRADCWDAPNCFGSPYMFDEACSECGTCKFGAKCRTLSAEVRIEIEAERTKWFKEKLGIEVPPWTAPPEIRPWSLSVIRTHHYLDPHKSRREAAKARDRKYRRARRANPDPATLIEAQYLKRLKVLQLLVSVRDGDKRLEQLHGRESEITLAWKARAIARLRHGLNASDAKVAQVYSELSGKPDYTRHQARGHRLLVSQLEEKVWAKFATPPDSLPDYLRVAAKPPRKAKARGRAIGSRPVGTRLTSKRLFSV